MGLAAVDRSVFILAENRLNLEQVFAELERLYQQPQAELHEVRPWSKPDHHPRRRRRPSTTPAWSCSATSRCPGQRVREPEQSASVALGILAPRRERQATAAAAGRHGRPRPDPGRR